MEIVRLRDAREAAEVGGKAANLSRVLAMGFPVPDGFVLSRRVLSAFLRANGLSSSVSSCLGSHAHGEPAEQDGRYACLCREVTSAPIPEDVRLEAEATALALLESAPAGLAIRSSAVCEDSEKTGFAGLFESTLGVLTLDDFWKGVRRCWCSSWSPMVSAYARRMGIVLPCDGMAVLVQPVVAARSAGVIFTADPLTGDPWRFVLNATPGLACDILGGSAAADHFALRWDTAAVIERRIVAKPTVLRAAGAKLERVSLSEAESSRAALSDAEVDAVGRMALEVDRAFGRRMDIEWALTADGVNLLQARPLTALPPFFPHELSATEVKETWMLSGDNPTAPLRPFSRCRSPLEMWRRHLEPDDIFPRLTAGGRMVNGYRYSTAWKWSGSPRGDDRVATERWLDSNEPRLRADWCAQLERVQSVNRRADRDTRKATRAVELVRLVLDYEREEDRMHAAVWYAPQWLAMACDRALRGLLEEVGLEPERRGLLGELLQGLSCYSSERTQAAQRLGRWAREESVHLAFREIPLARVIPHLRSLHPECGFLKRFGDLCRTYGLSEEISEDAQDLEGLLLTVRSSLPGAQPPARSVQKLLAAAAQRRRRREEEVREYLRLRRPEEIGRFEKLLDWAQFWTPALDNRKWHASMSVRRDSLILRAGEALTREGLIDAAADFRLLTPGEWTAYVEGMDAAGLRRDYERSRHEYERDSRLVPPPYLGQPPRPTPGAEAAALSRTAAGAKGGILRGQGLAPGHARGVSLKVASLDEQGYADLLRGEHILVCGRDTHNAQWRRDWYSLFLVARGLVTVGGAQLHHATQIARECGTPFVNLAEDSLDAIPDQTPIEIDGREGTVVVLRE